MKELSFRQGMLHMAKRVACEAKDLNLSSCLVEGVKSLLKSASTPLHRPIILKWKPQDAKSEGVAGGAAALRIIFSFVPHMAEPQDAPTSQGRGLDILDILLTSCQLLVFQTLRKNFLSSSNL